MGCPECKNIVKILPPNDFVVVDVHRKREEGLEEAGVYHPECYEKAKAKAQRVVVCDTWLLAKYRNKLTGHCHYIPVEGCEHAEWILRCMNSDSDVFEFVELYKKQEDKGE
jgi:hypothetical protein